MVAAHQYDSIGIGLPTAWTTFPVEQGAFDALCADLRRGWRDDPAWDRTTERRAELLLARVRAELRSAGIRAAGMYVESVTDGGDPGPDGTDDELLMATFTFGTHTRADLGTDLPLTLRNLAMAFTAPPRRTDEYRRITNLELPTLHELRPGVAVRLRRLYELRRPAAVADRFYGESFVFPLGDDEQVCAILSFTTTNLDVAPAFSSLFASIADTVTLWTPDEETDVRPLATDAADAPQP
jgi:hypothetical protein